VEGRAEVAVALRFLADEDFDNDLLRGLERRMPELDVLRVQDMELSGEPDPVILEWAAQEGRIVLTHDVSTMPGHADARMNERLPMAGVCVVPQSLRLGVAIEELLVAIACSRPKDWENQVWHLPL
jgi:hypothetical protein